MATIDNKKFIDELIANNGYYPGDSRIAQIVEYTNAFGKVTWGVTWIQETVESQRRYEIESPYVRNPKVIWPAS